MKIAARRRLAVGALATSTAVVAGLLVGPALAAPNGVTINPSAVVNTNAAAELTFTTTEADLTYGGSATFTRLGGGVPFTLAVDSTSPLPGAPLGDANEGTATFNATDGGNGLGTDGPADAGTYAVSIDGDEDPSGGLFGGGGGNDTCASCFTVLPAGPITVSSVAPNSLRPGNSGNVSILGNNFERGTFVEVLFPSGQVDTTINANQVPIVNGTEDTTQITLRTELQRRVTVGTGAQPGVRNVRVVNRDGSSALCSGCFFVAGAALTGVNPAGAFNDPGQALTTITFTGPNVVDGTPRLEFVGTPGAASRQDLVVRGENVRDYNGSSITADFDLRNAAPGSNAYQPFVEGQGGIVNACDSCRFTVNQRSERTPTLVALDRSNQAGVQKQLRQGETATFTASGTNFSKGANVVFDPPEGLTVTGVRFVSPEAFEVTVSAASDAEVGDKDATVLLTDGKQSAVCGACLSVVQGSGTASPGPSANPSASPGTGGDGDFAFARFAGNDRYATAAAIARGSFSTATTVVLANGQNDDPRTTRNESHFPDALAASYLAGSLDAPTLLATETTLPAPTSQALEALQTERVVIVGGTSAISEGVARQLQDDGYTVTRIAGQNRYDTAAEVARTPEATEVGEDPDGRRTAVLASGEAFADALVAGPLGYAARFPVLITARNTLSEQTAEILEELEISHVLIAGGTAAVSANVEAQVRANGQTTERFAGTDRFDTAALIAEYAYDSLGFDPTHVDLALGTEFADALAGGPHAGVQRAPILLTQRDTLPNRTAEVLRERGAGLEDGEIFGGTAAVSTRVENAAEAAVAEGSAEPEPSGSPGASGSPAPSGSASPGASASPSVSASPGASASPSVSASPGASPAVSASPVPSSTATTLFR